MKWKYGYVFKTRLLLGGVEKDVFLMHSWWRRRREGGHLGARPAPVLLWQAFIPNCTCTSSPPTPARPALTSPPNSSKISTDFSTWHVAPAAFKFYECPTMRPPSSRRFLCCCPGGLLSLPPSCSWFFVGPCCCWRKGGGVPTSVRNSYLNPGMS